MMNVQLVDLETYINIFPKYKTLKEHNKWKKYMDEYINNVYSDNKIDHEWINYIVYYEVEDDIHIYFRKFFIKSFNQTDTTTIETVKILFDDVIQCIKKQTVILPIDYLLDILQMDVKLNNHILLLKRDKSYRIQIKFQIYESKIKFYIKYCDFFECDIVSINDLLEEIYNKYLDIEKSKKKIIMINNNDKDFTCEDTIYDLQKFMYENGYWLDIVFYFNKNSFQNNCFLSNICLYFIKYDIILPTFITNWINSKYILHIKNKLIFVVPNIFHYDYINYLYDNIYIKTLNVINKNNNIVCIGKRNVYNPENIMIELQYNHGYDDDDAAFGDMCNLLHHTTQLEKNIINEIKTYTQNISVLKYNKTYKNQDLLDKIDFFKIHNLDPNKKLITIFTRWPKLFKKSNYSCLSLSYGFNLFSYESNTIELLINSLKDKYNIIFKLHPGYLKINNKTKYSLYAIRNEQTEIYRITNNEIFINNQKYKGLNFFKDYTIIDDNFEMEIYKYTDFGIIFNQSSTIWKCAVYDIPMVEISSKKNDWFNVCETKKTKLNNEQFQVLNNYPAWINRQPYDNHKYVYGSSVYWEDIKDDLINNLDKIFSKDYKSEFKYLKNHPIIGNEYFSTQNDIGKTILEVINKHRFNDTFIKNDLRYDLYEEAITVYQKTYIDVLLENETITIEILKDPYKNEKFVSSGVSVYIYNINPLCKINMEFNIKLDTKEEDVCVLLYTGIKWIVYEETLTIEFKKLSITEDFNLENISKWRLITTSRKVGQKITIKDLNFKLSD